MKFHTGKWFLGGLVFGIIMWLVNGAIGMLTGGLYTGTVWRAMQGSMYWFLVFLANIVGGLLFALMYAFLYRGIPVRSGSGRGAFFGFLVFLGTTIYGMAMTFLFMNVSMLVMLTWVLGGFISYIIGGLALGAIYHPKQKKE